MTLLVSATANLIVPLLFYTSFAVSANGLVEINNGKENSVMDIYRHFLERGLTDSHRHFSSAWLGRAENYLCLRAGRGPSPTALIELFQTLWREGEFALAAKVAWALLWLKPEARR